MKMFLKFFLLFGCLQLSQQLTLECNFKFHSTYLGERYSCVVKNFHTSFNNRTITKVVGEHLDRKSNADVNKIFLKFQNCPYLPLNLHDFFPNIEIIYVMKSNLQHVLPGDLDGLNKLEVFDVSHNPIEDIPKDFFVGHETITKISFFDCHIKKVERGALEPLKNLQHAFFDYNECISEQEKYKSDIPAFIANLYDKCDGKGHYIKQKPEDNPCDNKLQNEPQKEEIHHSRNPRNGAYYIAVVFIIFLLFIIIILSVTMLKIYQNYFRSNWHEMKSALTATS